MADILVLKSQDLDDFKADGINALRKFRGILTKRKYTDDLGREKVFIKITGSVIITGNITEGMELFVERGGILVDGKIRNNVIIENHSYNPDDSIIVQGKVGNNVRLNSYTGSVHLMKSAGKDFHSTAKWKVTAESVGSYCRIANVRINKEDAPELTDTWEYLDTGVIEIRKNVGPYSKLQAVEGIKAGRIEHNYYLVANKIEFEAIEPPSKITALGRNGTILSPNRIPEGIELTIHNRFRVFAPGGYPGENTAKDR